MIRNVSIFIVVFCICCNQFALRTIDGEIAYKKNKKICSKMACRCCNTCYVPIEIATGKDTVELWVLRSANSSRVGVQSLRALNGLFEGDIEQLVCNFNECDSIDCSPLSFGVKYCAHGYWRNLENGKKVFAIKSLPVLAEKDGKHNLKGAK